MKYFLVVRYFCFVFILTGWCHSRAEAQVTPDPGLPGPYAVTKEIYDLGDFLLSSPRGPLYNAELLGSVHYPSSLSAGPFPIVVLLHGNHIICYRNTDSACGYIWPVPAGNTVIPNYDGYDYFARQLASHGFVVISISCNSVNYNAHDMKDRAYLIQKHLDVWSQFNTVGGAPFGTKFIGKIDFAHVGLMGHSRGGEGVVTYANYNRSIGSPYNIEAVVAIGPTRFSDPYLNRVPFMNIAAYCDGDVGVGTGLLNYDVVRYNDDMDEAPKYVVLMMGANHNFFNTVWTPKSYPACGKDDWTADFWPFCNPLSSTTGRYDSLQQRRALVAYASAFFRTHLKGDTSFRPLLQVEDIMPPASTTLDSSRVFVSYHPGANRRLDINTMLSKSNLDTNDLKGKVTSRNLSSIDILSCPYSHYNALESTCVSWRGDTGYYQNEIPAAYQDFSRYYYLMFRTSFIYPEVTKASGKIDFSVQLTDSFGNKEAHLFSTRSNSLFNYIDDVVPISNTVKFPLSAFLTVDLAKIREVSFVFDKSDKGALFFSDIALGSARRLCLLKPDFSEFYVGGQKVFFSDSSVGATEDSLVWSWNFGEPLSGTANTSSLKDPYHQFRDSGYFDVCLHISAYGSDGLICHDSICKRIYIEYDPVLHMTDYEAEEDLLVYPNPAKDFFIVKGAKAGDHVQIVNALGQCVYNISADSGNAIRCRLNNGIYTVLVSRKGQRYIRKLCVIGDL